jgi:hypothetical protein
VKERERRREDDEYTGEVGIKDHNSSPNHI